MITGYNDDWKSFANEERESENGETETEEVYENYDCYIVDGPPRLSHKTTKIIQGASGFANELDAGVPVIVDNNYEQIEETVENHLNGGRYGVEPNTVAVPKGKDKATTHCPDDCDHEVDGSSFGKIKAVAREVATQNRVVRPSTFRGEDVCAYQGAKFAMEHADAIVCVVQMLPRISDSSYFPERYQLIIDEESTQEYFKPSGFKLAEIQPSPSDIGPPFIVDFEINETNINNLAQRENSKIDELERVASRYRNVVNGCSWLDDILKEASNFDFSDNPEIEDYKGHLESIPERVESPDLQGPMSEKSATFDRLRMHYHRFHAGNGIEPAFFDPEIQVTSSGDKFDVKVVPDPFDGFVITEKVFREATNVWLVGDLIAKHIADEVGLDYDYTKLEPKDRDLDDLKIIMASCENGDEFDRRRFMTDLSKELAEQRVPHPVFAGSGLRAQQAKERIGPSSYFFNAAAERRHFEEVADIGYAVTSYPGSRISRGVDLSTNITIVRSTQFQSGIWDYQGDDKTARKCERMREYSKEIEVHNMMLRGAGQGERHVAVVPSMIPYFGLSSVVEEVSIYDDIKDVLSEILAWVEAVEKRDGVYWCDDCSTGFMSMSEYLDHRLTDRMPAG